MSLKNPIYKRFFPAVKKNPSVNAEKEHFDPIHFMKKEHFNRQ
jgi:hypothetical protein